MTGDDGILLRGIAVSCLVGVYPHERRAPRPLSIDLELACDLRAAGASDAVADTVDYAAVTELVRERCAALAPALIERLAEDIAARLLQRFPLQAVTITVHKPGVVDGVDDIAVRLHRRADGHAAPATAA